MDWISVRNKWPNFAGEYVVQDCRYKIEGKATYDGYEWQMPDYVLPEEGGLVLNEYTITHWKENV